MEGARRGYFPIMGLSTCHLIQNFIPEISIALAVYVYASPREIVIVFEKDGGRGEGFGRN